MTDSDRTDGPPMQQRAAGLRSRRALENICIRQNRMAHATEITHSVLKEQGWACAGRREYYVAHPRTSALNVRVELPPFSQSGDNLRTQTSDPPISDPVLVWGCKVSGPE